LESGDAVAALHEVAAGKTAGKNLVAPRHDGQYSGKMTPDAVLSYLASNEKRFIEELFEYTRIPSISAQSDHADDMRRCAQ